MITKKKFIIIAVIIAAAIIAAVLVAVVLNNKSSDIDDNGQSQAFTNSVVVNGERYNYNQKLKNILVLGIDNSDDISKKGLPGRAGQSDVILIVSMNTETGDVKILDFSRDTMTTIQLYDIYGNEYTKITGQIGLQYAYGIGGEHSCSATKKTLLSLINGLPGGAKIQIDGYVSMNFEAVKALVNGLGGITLTMDDDYTYIDESLTSGSTVKLNGDLALSFIRYRDCNEFGSNNKRMRRQALMIPAIVDAVTARIKNVGDFYKAIYPLVEDYVVTDLTADQMNEMADYSFASAEVIYAPGTTAAGEEHEEFTLDETALEEIILEMFYVKK